VLEILAAADARGPLDLARLSQPLAARPVPLG
jgi:hypothetical protein